MRPRAIMLGLAGVAVVVALSACSNGPTSLTVNGTVLGELGEGHQGATVAVVGVSGSTTTDSNGKFTISNVASPYALVVVETATSGPVAQVFEGLSTANPTVLPLGALQGTVTYKAGTISGSVSPAVPTGDTLLVCAQGVSVRVFGCTTVAAAGTTYTLNITWAQGSSVSVTVRALQRTLDADGYTTNITGSVSSTTTVTNGGTSTLNLSVGTPPSTGTLTGNVNVPAGFTLEDVYGGAQLSSSYVLPVFSASSGTGLSTSFTATVPVFTGASYMLTAAAYPSTGGAASIAWEQGLTAGGSATLTLPTPPSLTAPANGATGIGVGSTLSLASAGGGAATFILTATSQPTVAVTTMSSSITIPDLSAFGVSLPAATSYTWQAIVSPTATTANEAAHAWIGDYIDAFQSVQSGGPPSSVDSGSIMGTDSRSFTTP